MTETMMTTLRADRAVALVRAETIPDPVALAAALSAGGIRTLELAFTTPDVLALIAEAAAGGALVGAGTVLTPHQAEAAVAAGARFLVTPGVVPAVAAVARDADVPLLMGAMTPTEVAVAQELGAAAVKVFPAATVGAAHFRHLRGPLPDIDLVASGGLTAANAREYLDAGAVAVTAGSSVVSAADLAARRWGAITSSAREFVAALG